MRNLPHRPRCLWTTVVPQSCRSLMDLLRPKYSVKAIGNSREVYADFCAHLAIEDIVTQGQLLLQISGRQTSHNADKIGLMKALADILYALSQSNNDSRLLSIGAALQEEVYNISRKMFGDQSKHVALNLRLLCSWDISSTKRRALLQECQVMTCPSTQASRWLYWHYEYYEGSQPEATKGLLFACLRNGEFWSKVELMLKGYNGVDGWSVHQLRLYIGRNKWDEAEKFGERLLEDEVLKSQRWKKLAVLGLLAEVKISQGKSLEGEQLFVKVVKEGLTNKGPPHVHSLLCGDRLADIYLSQKKLAQARKLLHFLIELKER
ncbi:hypothetical protein CPB83DRAFT_465075 [Crepidotus variabilis]|uniref:Uncharacterized protein n=1 Tax=Crepidotus variabilis TaxID=179855 RepID=A0A9P6EC09_9AGAR|nr:hypothetical protein CPB83DRAFT_465075 [Crepidotus variabilis]